MKLNSANIEGRFYLNGFPKAGLHLLDLMLRPMAMPMPHDPLWNTPWAGLYRGNSWTTEQYKMELLALKISRVTPGNFMKGHLGCDSRIERFLYYMGITKYFIYRDFRDVAVSQAYHIMVEDPEDFPHPGKAEMQKHGFDSVLLDVINGYREFPGVMERWELYAPWLDVDWVFSVSFEDIIADRLGWAEKMIDHFFGRMSFILEIPTGDKYIPDEQRLDIAQEMVKLSKRTRLSTTFRKGLVGEWETHFKEQHIQAFKEHDVNNWLVRLGYEGDVDW